MRLNLTREDVENDIAGFEARIQAARDKLNELPATASTYPERKRLKAARRKLESKIKHVGILQGYALSALAEFVG